MLFKVVVVEIMPCDVILRAQESTSDGSETLTVDLLSLRSGGRGSLRKWGCVLRMTTLVP